MRSELVKEFVVEAAHDTPRSRGRFHGHSYLIEVAVSGAVDPERGWVVDYGDIKQAFAPFREQLDHAMLNDIAGLRDVTLGGVRTWLRRGLSPALPGLSDVRVSIVGDCAWRPEVMPAGPGEESGARVRFTFEAAHCLPATPASHKCHRPHGHSYRVEVAANAPDGLLEPLRAAYDALDHRYLNDLPGLGNATSEVLAGYLWDRLAADVRGLRTITVQETCSARCIYHGH